MLDLLCRIRYSRLFFTVMVTVGTWLIWTDAWAYENSKAVSGTVNHEPGLYVFLLFIVAGISFLILLIANAIFDLDFQYSSDKFQDYFKELRHERIHAEMEADAKKRAKALRECEEQAAEDRKVAEFITYCKKKGGKRESY